MPHLTKLYHFPIMPRAFVVDPTAKTVTPCAPNTIDRFKDRVGQGRHVVTFCTETADGCLVELTGVGVALEGLERHL